jgi:hypothetical protein
MPVFGEPTPAALDALEALQSVGRNEQQLLPASDDVYAAFGGRARILQVEPVHFVDDSRERLRGRAQAFTRNDGRRIAQWCRAILRTGTAPFRRSIWSWRSSSTTARLWLRSSTADQLDIATHAAYVDEPALALEALQNASRYFAINTVFVWTPLFRDVRRLDEFKSYLREIGMVDVWRDIGWPDLCEPTGGDDFRCD